MNKHILLRELTFKAVRSGGPGGQHANKVASKVEVALDIPNSNALTAREKELLLLKLSKRMSNAGILLLQSDVYRSQHRNKEEVIARLLALLKKALAKPKKRKPTRPPRAAKEKRLQEKKKASEKKANRMPPNF